MIHFIRTFDLNVNVLPESKKKNEGKWLRKYKNKKKTYKIECDEKCKLTVVTFLKEGQDLGMNHHKSKNALDKDLEVVHERTLRSNISSYFKIEFQEVSFKAI
jgi:hypothetical protein